jgi:hypothetical protein
MYLTSFVSYLNLFEAFSHLYKGTKHYHLYNNDGNRIELEHSDGEKDIGVFVDENLSFNKYIQNQVNKANSIMGLIRRTYTYLDEQSFKYLFPVRLF